MKICKNCFYFNMNPRHEWGECYHEDSVWHNYEVRESDTCSQFEPKEPPNPIDYFDGKDIVRGDNS